MSEKEKAIALLQDKCFLAGLSLKETDMCIDFFINKLDHSEIAVKYYIAIQTSMHKKCKFKKLLKR